MLMLSGVDDLIWLRRRQPLGRVRSVQAASRPASRGGRSRDTLRICTGEERLAPLRVPWALDSA